MIWMDHNVIQSVVVVNVVLLEQIGSLLEVAAKCQPLLVPVALDYLACRKTEYWAGYQKEATLSALEKI